MPLIINTSFDPFFCALLDSQSLEVCRWNTSQESGQAIWNFCAERDIRNKKVSFLGIVSGPGNFSHLRTGGSIINVMSLYFGLPIHQVRSDKVFQDFLSGKPFVLDSFGQGIFYLEKNKLLRAKNFESLPPTIQESRVGVSLLPKEKQKKFPHGFEFSLEGIEKATLEVLQKQTPQKVFVPDYEYPAVE